MPKIELIARVLWVEREKVLLCRNLEHRHCYLPGGHVEFGESIQAAAVRELREEAGIEVRVTSPIQSFESVFEQKGKLRHEIVFVCQVQDAPCPASEVRSIEDGLEFLTCERGLLAGEGFVPREQMEWLGRRGGDNSPILRSAIRRIEPE